MKKYLSAGVLAGALAFGALLPSGHAQGISIKIDGLDQYYKQSPVIQNGTTLVPLRGIFETFGATVQYEDATKTITATKKGTMIKLTIGAKKAFKNGQEVSLTNPGLIINESTMVPIRFISESFGADVRWDPTTQTVIINQQKEVAVELSESKQAEKNALSLVSSKRLAPLEKHYDKVTNELFFEGDMRDEVPHGYGRLYDNGIIIYEGEWRNGTFNGLGIYYKTDGTVTWAGQWDNNNFMTGAGKAFYNSGDLAYNGEWLNGKPHGEGKEYSDSLGTRDNSTLVYEGQWIEGIYHGEGKTFYGDGKLQYEGTWKIGKRDGKGKYYSDNGVLTYEGEFKENKYDGNGTFYHPEQRVKLYEGEWANGEYHGQGTSYFLDGSIWFTGEWKNGGYWTGKGIEYHTDLFGNKKYEGTWVEGLYHGAGTLYYSNGNKQYLGEFKFGKFDGIGTSYTYGGQFGDETTIEYIGGWKEGKYDGQGKLYFTDFRLIRSSNHNGNNVKYDGTWKQGQKHGNGILYNYMYGTAEYNGTWEYDRKITGTEYEPRNGQVKYEMENGYQKK